MSLTINPPNTIHLGGRKELVGDLAASEAIYPGMLVELFNNGGIHRWRKSTLTDKVNSSFAVNQTMLNLGVNDACAAGDLIPVGVGSPGCTIWGLIASGASVAKGAELSDAGNGYFKARASGITIARALETINNTNGDANTVTGLAGVARIRVEFV